MANQSVALRWKRFNLVWVWPELAPTGTSRVTARHKPYGLLEPLPTAKRAWGSISMDFITGLPDSMVPDGTDVSYDAIWVVVDRLTKWAYFLP